MEDKDSKKPKKHEVWHENAETMVGSYSILAALASVLLTAVILDSQISGFNIPVILFSISIILFIWGIEKFSDALDENDVDKFLTWFLAYNTGVITLFFGIAFLIIDHYKTGLLYSLIILGIITLCSKKWIYDNWYLIFKNEEEYSVYKEELRGERLPELDKDSLMWLHQFLRKLVTRSKNKILPHQNVCTRLGTSKIHGVGIFAIRDIGKGTNLFLGDQSKIVWIDKADIDKLHLDKNIQKLYDDFCVLDDGRYGCPENFNNLTVGWYLNEPQGGGEPNVYCDKNFDFFAIRDIKEGEELTVDYSTYSQ